MLLAQLKVFHAILKHGSFTHAGEYLHLSQPAVSSSIKRLEEELGVELFHRFGKQVQLTEAGKVLERHVSRLLASFETLKSEIDEIRGFQASRLSCAVSTTIGVYILPKVVVDFKKRFPDVEARVFFASTAEAERKVIANEVDFGLVAGRVTNITSLKIFPFLNDELVIIAPPGHPIAKHSKVGPERLREFPLILREKGAPARILIETSLRKAGISHRCGMELDSLEAIKRVVSEGLGISIVSLAATAREIQSKFLVPVRISGCEIRREFKVIIQKGKRLSNPLKTFLALLGAERIP